MRILSALAVVILALAVGAQFAYPKYTYRYRLSVTTEIDGTKQIASSVIEVAMRESPFGGGGGTLEGQAPFLDLADQGVLIFSLGADYSDQNARSAIWIGAKTFGNNSSISQISAFPNFTGRRALPPQNWPLVIWFSMPGDPTIRQILDPNNLHSASGGRMQVLSAEVEITRSPVVIDIDRKTPSWLRPVFDEKYRGLLLRPGDGIVGSVGEFIVLPLMVLIKWVLG